MSKVNSLSGCVLLDACKADWDVFRMQFFDDWKIELEGENNETELDFSINGVDFVCMLVDQKVDLAIENASKNYSWAGAAAEIGRHTAHIQIYLLDCEHDLQRHVLFSMVASSMLKQEGAIGLYQYPVTRRASDYIEESQRMNKDELPVLNWLYIGLYQDQENKWNAYSYGMEEFGRDDMEILHSNQPLTEVYLFMVKLIQYLISSGDALTPGEPVGIDDAHVYMVTRSEAEALGGESLKIAF